MKYGLNLLLFLLLSAWTLHFIYPVIYTVATIHIHEHQHELIESNEQLSLEKVSLDLCSFNKFYNSQAKELNIDGQYYDVAKVEKTGNTVACYVISDIKETRLNKTLSYELQHQENFKNTKLANCWWPVVLMFHSIQAQFVHIPAYNEKEYFSLVHTALLNGHKLAVIQPPRLA